MSIGNSPEILSQRILVGMILVGRSGPRETSTARVLVELRALQPLVHVVRVLAELHGRDELGPPREEVLGGAGGEILRGPETGKRKRVTRKADGKLTES